MNIARSNAKELWVLILIEIFDPNPKPQLQTQAKAPTNALSDHQLQTASSNFLNQ